jgi:hypothetical protein
MRTAKRFPTHPSALELVFSAKGRSSMLDIYGEFWRIFDARNRSWLGPDVSRLATFLGRFAALLRIHF